VLIPSMLVLAAKIVSPSEVPGQRRLRACMQQRLTYTMATQGYRPTPASQPIGFRSVSDSI